MARNIEIKARVSDPTIFRARVVDLAPHPSVVLSQVDTFFKLPHGRLKLREFSDREAELIYYERPDQAGPKNSNYTITPIPEAASMKVLLARFLEVRGVVAKKRELFLLGQTRVHLDEVDGLGSFVELEVVLKEYQSDSEGIEIANKWMEQLGIRTGDLIDAAYVDLLEVKKGS